MDSSVAKEVVYLEEDKPIRGQNYVCMSFLSPEDILPQKDVFFVNKFLDSLAKDLSVMLMNLRSKYPQDAMIFDSIKDNQGYFFNHDQLQEQFRFFKQEKGHEVEEEFHALNNFRPTIRGFKVRGVFDTYQEAELRAKALKRMGDKFDIYVAHVGCWCPWSPYPNELSNQEYANDQLNELMKKYRENMELRESFHDERIRTAVANSARQKAEREQANALEDEDPWLARKRRELETKEVAQDVGMKIEIEPVLDAAPALPSVEEESTTDSKA
jgi:hypothetical protein